MKGMLEAKSIAFAIALLALICGCMTEVPVYKHRTERPATCVGHDEIDGALTKGSSTPADVKALLGLPYRDLPMQGGRRVLTYRFDETWEKPRGVPHQPLHRTIRHWYWFEFAQDKLVMWRTYTVEPSPQPRAKRGHQAGHSATPPSTGVRTGRRTET